MRKTRFIENCRCYHLISRLAHQAFFLDDDEKTRAIELLRWVEEFVSPPAQQPGGATRRGAGWEKLSGDVSQVLDELLGSSPFVPLAHVSQQTLDSLPPLTLDGEQVEWTRELLASVAYYCLPEVGTLNHAKLPYGVTTLLVPPGVKDMTDGVEYMLEIYKERYGRGVTVEGAFIFLKENNVRANFVESLNSPKRSR